MVGLHLCGRIYKYFLSEEGVLFSSTCLVNLRNMGLRSDGTVMLQLHTLRKVKSTKGGKINMLVQHLGTAVVRNTTRSWL